MGEDVYLFYGLEKKNGFFKNQAKGQLQQAIYDKK